MVEVLPNLELLVSENLMEEVVPPILPHAYPAIGLEGSARYSLTLILIDLMYFQYIGIFSY